jgi:hypothetical protein
MNALDGVENPPKDEFDKQTQNLGLYKLRNCISWANTYYRFDSKTSKLNIVGLCVKIGAKAKKLPFPDTNEFYNYLTNCLRQKKEITDTMQLYSTKVQQNGDMEIHYLEYK